MTINFNSYPYYDDFDHTKNFYKVLFKPGYAVQARELNQLQSISQHQISSFANHIFKKNSMVIPGGIVLDNMADLLFTLETNPENFIGKTITNAPLNNGVYDINKNTTAFDNYITAVILDYKEKDDTFPACFHIKYFNSYSGGLNSPQNYETDPPRMKFTNTDTIYTIEDNPILCNLDISNESVSTGKVVSIDNGIFYTKKLFVDVFSQRIIIDQNSGRASNCTIGLNIEESIVNSTNDDSLLDNAQGYPNQYAPGADRYKVELILTKIDNNTQINDDKFIRLMTIENNVITYQNNNAQYSELLKTLAKRTYDANGNFIVNGLKPVVNKSNNDDYIWVNVGKGSCYLGGYEYNQLNNINLPISKPRNNHTIDIPEISTYSDDMPFFYVATGLYDTNKSLISYIPKKNEIVKFISSSNIEYDIGDETIGYGVFKELQLFSESTTNSIYKMFFTNITIESGKNIENIGGYVKIGTSTKEGAPILTEYKVEHVNKFTYFNAPIYFGGNVPGITLGFTGTEGNCLLYYISADKLYTMKLKDNIITVASEIHNGLSDSTACTSHFITNNKSEFYPMIKVDDNTIKTLKVNEISSLSYSIIRLYEIANVGSDNTKTFSISNESNSRFEDFSNNDYSLYNHTSKQFITLNSALVTFDDQFTSLTLDTTSLHNTILTLYTTIIKSNISETSNVLTTATVVISNPTSSWIALGHQNIQNIISIKDSGNIAISPNDNDSAKIDITNRYILSSGASATEITTGCIKLKRNCIAPSGQISVEYQYIPNITSGYYSCVDSYKGSSVDLSYISKIQDVYDSKKNLITLRNYIDFRPTHSNYFFKNYGKILANTKKIYLKDINLSYYHPFYNTMGSNSNTELYIIGPGCEDGRAIASTEIINGTNDTVITLKDNVLGQSYAGIYYVGLSHSKNLIDTNTNILSPQIPLVYGLGREFVYPKDLARINYSYTKFTPKHIHLFINRIKDSLEVTYKEVSSYQDILKYRRDEFNLPLAYIYMKPYTIGINDVTIEKFENPVYQMLDIHEINERVKRNEYYTSLSLNNDVHQELLDANVENYTESARGMWNEDFESAFTQDYTSPDFKCTIYDKTYAIPGTVTRTINLVKANTELAGRYKLTGSTVTLEYKEVKAFGNSSASTFNNLNPYNVKNWKGKLTLNPTVDNWVDVVTLPSVTTPLVIETKEKPPEIIEVVGTIKTKEKPPEIVETIIPPPRIDTLPPVIVPQPPIIVEEIVTEINNMKSSWGRDSKGGFHAITFEWKTNLGRTGRVNTDSHLSNIIKEKGWNGSYAFSLKNKMYNLPEVKEYLHAGTHFDSHPASVWIAKLNT